ncbi:MAG: hypothetical protein LBJ47_09940 [Tannerella sp.]|jgi:hypothetical protein|nr:hypothetical protein [Tannerella sp.]
MDEVIEILAEKVLNSLSGWSLPDQAHIMREIADRLTELSGECLKKEYCLYLTDENE